MKKVTDIRGVLIPLVLCTILPACATAETAPAPESFARRNPRVLVLHSYHYGFTWSENISEGIRAVFDSLAPGVEIITEYMDVKRIYGEEYFGVLKQFLLLKYGRYPIDVIIAADDWAVEFLLGIGSEILPGTPLVFCGLNDYDPERHKGNGRDITGVVEDIDIKSTLEVALSLHQSVTDVAYISDPTITGSALKRNAERVFDEYRDTINFHYIEHRSMGQLQQRVKDLPDTSVVIAFIFTHDRYGRIWSHEYNLERLVSKCPYPIYSVWEFYLGHGIVGGMLTSGMEQGKTAALLAYRILDGENAADIPIVTKSPNVYKFDYVYLEHFGIDLDDLPENSIVINEPFSVYQEYKYVIWSSIALFLLLIIVVVLLVGNTVLRRRSQLAQKISEERFRSFMDHVPGLVFIKEPSGKIIFANQGFYSYLDLKPETIVDKNDEGVFPPELSRKLGFDDRQVLESGRSEEVEVSFAGRIWSIHKLTISQTNGPALLGSIALDITERKHAEERLKTSLQEKDTLLHELYHRTKNNMQVISAFLELQAISSGNEEVERIIRESQFRMQTMALAHDKLYRSQDLSRIDMERYCIDLARMLMSIYDIPPHKIDIRFDIQNIKLLIDLAIPCGLIINELLSNSFKYAFPQGRKGRITIGLHRINAHQLVLSITDNGIGLPPDFDVMKSETLGVQIVHQIVEHQLHGSINVASDRGLKWRITFRDDLYSERV
ncbi:MAG: PAS domain S-box protein [Chitinivibrionales bacterium]|nr:PAS domain S-box protein [Chitinivibrionales bacterium]